MLHRMCARSKYGSLNNIVHVPSGGDKKVLLMIIIYCLTVIAVIRNILFLKIITLCTGFHLIL